MTHLNTLMTAQVEIELCWMCNTDVDGCTSWNITRFATLFLLVSTEQASVMTFLDNDEGDTWAVVSLEFDASLSDGGQLMLQDVRELSLGDTVAVENDSVWFVATCRFVEHHEQLAHHTAELLDHLLTMLLDSNCCGIA